MAEISMAKFTFSKISIVFEIGITHIGAWFTQTTKTKKRKIRHKK